MKTGILQVPVSSATRQGPDYKNWGVTLPSVIYPSRRFDEANSNGVGARSRGILGCGRVASAAIICRTRAIRYVTEAKSAVAFWIIMTHQFNSEGHNGMFK